MKKQTSQTIRSNDAVRATETIDETTLAGATGGGVLAEILKVIEDAIVPGGMGEIGLDPQEISKGTKPIHN